MNIGFRQSWLWLVFPCFLLVFSVSSYGQELLVNGGFESGQTGWTQYTQGAGSSAIIDSTGAFQGNGVARLTITPETEDGIVAFYQIVPTIPAQRLYFEYTVKTGNGNMMAFAFFQWLDADGTVKLQQSFYPSGSGEEWRTYHSRLNIPPGMKQVIVFLLISGNGSVWFDNVSLLPESAPYTAAFSVTANGNIGKIRPFLSTNAGPVNLRSNLNLTSDLKRMGIHFIRTHDYHGPCDIHEIFSNWNADPENPGSYNFSGTDQFISNILKTGATVFFRLGESYESIPVHNNPPPDLAVWANVCRHIVRHYNDGWNNGFHYNIRYWEVWNEPDLKIFWTGTAEQYARFYEAAANAVKEIDPTLRVGGPAVANIADTAFLDTFLNYIREHDVPIDFFSYHYYGGANPYYYLQMNRDVKGLLANYGLDNIPIFLTEWNSWYYDPSNIIDWGRDDPLNAASAAAILTYLQDANLAGAFRYRTDEYYFGLFHDDGSLSYSGLVFQMLSRFRETPVRIPASGGDKLGQTILAGRSDSGEELAVLISDTASAVTAYNCQIEGLAEGKNYHYFQYRIDASHRFELAGTGVITDSAPEISGVVTAPFTELILIFREKVFHFPSPVFQQNKIPVSSY